MTCRACHLTAHPGSRFGLCWGHAWLFALGPWKTVEAFILRTLLAPDRTCV